LLFNGDDCASVFKGQHEAHPNARRTKFTVVRWWIANIDGSVMHKTVRDLLNPFAFATKREATFRAGMNVHRMGDGTCAIWITFAHRLFCIS
jgi:hypothetical protein